MTRWMTFGKEEGQWISFYKIPTYPHIFHHLQNGIMYGMKNSFELVEENAVNSPVEDIKWYGKSDQTDEKLMHDSGKGEPVLIRLFEFRLSPTIETLPTKEQVLTPEYIKHLKTLLWADGLRLLMEPRLVIDKESIKIFAPCQASMGNNFLEEPKTIQEWTN